MLHENLSGPEVESQQAIDRRRRWSLSLLFVFTAFYAGFIALCAFAYQWFSRITWLGIPAPVWYGLAIILLALAIAGIYGRVTRTVTKIARSD